MSEDSPNHLNLRLRYFAVLRKQAGCDSEKCRTSAATPDELYAELEATGAALEAKGTEKQKQQYTKNTLRERLFFEEASLSEVWMESQMYGGIRPPSNTHRGLLGRLGDLGPPHGPAPLVSV